MLVLGYMEISFSKIELTLRLVSAGYAWYCSIVLECIHWTLQLGTFELDQVLNLVN